MNALLLNINATKPKLCRSYKILYNCQCQLQIRRLKIWSWRRMRKVSVGDVLSILIQLLEFRTIVIKFWFRWQSECEMRAGGREWVRKERERREKQKERESVAHTKKHWEGNGWSEKGKSFRIQDLREEGRLFNLFAMKDSETKTRQLLENIFFFLSLILVLQHFWDVLGQKTESLE